VEAVDLLAMAAVAVSNDSGLMHVAAAVGTHTVAIYGSSTPDFTPPLTDKATIHYRRLECSPCFERTCPLGHLDCLNGIEVDEVVAGVVEKVHSASVGG
jgi:heptosyltransferase-2